MSLTPGTRLGPYEIVAAIGAGGMGEVYKARDTRLDRTVAIKILPEAFAADADRVARFQREAKTLAALNHPNIAQIFGLEQAGDVQALAMEFVAGNDLSDRIARGAIPIDEALPIAKQIAEALEAAHEQGIIHRDLKPANIKVREDGTVKVLDFGLAKAMDSLAPSPDMSQSPTITTPAMTQAGMILGTAAYMSPEQARGKPVDKRVDVWAFGCVLYEMLTGRRAFGGENISDTLALVLRGETDWTTLPSSTPVGIRRVLRRCLEKEPRRRLHDLADARVEIEDAVSGRAIDTEPIKGVRLVSKWKSSILLAWALAVALALALGVGGVMLARGTRPVQHPLVRLDVDLGSGEPLNFTLGPNVEISPDGGRLAYVAGNRLVTRRLDQAGSTEHAGTEGAFSPFFSPDGRWIAFFTGGKLKKVSVEGGAAILLCDCLSGTGENGGSWGEDGTIVFSRGGGAGLARISSAGGVLESLTNLSSSERQGHAWPQILPGGKVVLFSANTQLGAWDDATIDAISLEDHHTTTLVRGGTFGRYLPSGHLVYVSGGTLFALPFDMNSLSARGPAVPVLEDVAYSTANGSAQLSVSTNGVLIFQSATPAELLTVQWLDDAGHIEPLLMKPGFYVRPHFSPVGSRLAVALNRDIWVFDWQRDKMDPLTFNEGLYPAWTPNGRYLVFAPRGGGMSWIRADGAGKPEPLIQSPNPEWPWSFTPDGHRLAFQEQNPGTGWDIFTVPVDESGAALRAEKPEAFLQTPFTERNPSFSTDGRWVAYSSNESGLEQVYVKAFPDTGGKVPVSNAGGRQPTWSPNASELFFRSEDNRVMVASYTVVGDVFRSENPRVWSERRLANVGLNGTYDVAQDGKRIAALMPVEGATQQGRTRVVYIENFFDELRRLAPPGKR